VPDRHVAGALLSAKAGRDAAIFHQQYTPQICCQNGNVSASGRSQGGGIFDHSHVQLCGRDVAGVAAHIVGNWDMPTVNYGQVILGSPLTDPMF
jgi:hypothetical protein